jgi:hypothetical protein
MPAGMTLETFDLLPLPMFNQDAEKSFPGAVVEFRTRQNGAAGCSGAMNPKDREFVHHSAPDQCQTGFGHCSDRAQRCMSRWWARNEGDCTKNTAKAPTAASAVS